jgi:hypothetical protein
MNTFTALRVELTFPNGSKQALDAQKVEFVKQCRNCNEEFRTNDPRKEYHSVGCREAAKYLRSLAR